MSWRTADKFASERFAVRKLPLFTAMALALLCQPGLAANNGMTWNGISCFEQFSYTPQDTVILPKESYADGLKELGAERMHAVLLAGMEFLRACIILKDAPIRWSQERLKAMVAMDTALPITAGRVHASDACGSTLYNAGCVLNIEYTIQNVTDDFTFTSVGVSCDALLKHDPKRDDRSRGNAWRMGPGHGSILKPLISPYLGSPRVAARAGANTFWPMIVRCQAITPGKLSRDLHSTQPRTWQARFVPLRTVALCALSRGPRSRSISRNLR